MDINNLKQQVKKKLSFDRYAHTLRVTDTALELAEIYGLPLEQVEVASLLHDYAKCDTRDELSAAIKQYDLPEELFNYHHELWHGPVGAMRLKHELGIPTEDIYHAVYFHTTARAGMTPLELVVFVADYIEPARNFPGVDEVRRIARIDLKLATHKAIQNSMLFILAKSQTIHPDTLYAYNDLTNYIRSVK